MYVGEVHTVLVGSPSDRDHLEDVSVGHTIVLKWIFMNLDEGAQTL